MSTNIEELKKFLENKITELKKELEYYEYLLSLLETEGYKNTIKVNRGIADIIKNTKGEIIAEIYYTPPLVRVVFKGKITVNRIYANVINKILENEKNKNKIEYNITFEKDELKEITIDSIKDELLYNRIKAALQSVLERISH
ncbi:hypothetical protein [Sulfolobus acidocaldarius]|uniref:Conserved protein n=4 Tax=Sulfolobus acidocaldarius TaxID=2285 RepID=Q4JAQ4_SULAC|nr:hypothetical protein [Sulfolobus acidocaldarius]AAY80125.1 conserved protein [Sulfolobus acidocaldarius DSM 639]AGE70700.1 hypothetical protein SacN8_03640 [Sulfolobus acidocaldarius N8]AGE72972.1 hypothetical protein SacRon12I_03625 [Sulfolobus acidocaldarius Ron12/I]ALU28960.1 hypothetical protein ATY89_02665 [Sulfolobus acidocaldarius]ALU31687.1 hypothetical protein ATZ20_05690 [Sulfolobus acidocaldarius]